MTQQTHLIADLTAQLQTEKLQYDSRLDFSTKQRDLLEAECDKHKNLIAIFQQELDASRSQAYEMEQRMSLITQ